MSFDAKFCNLCGQAIPEGYHHQVNKNDCLVVNDHSSAVISFIPHKKKEAIRVERDVRYDILTPEFLEAMAKIAHYGAVKYGDFNWQISRLTGNKGPVNHILKHIMSYQRGEAYDHSELGTGKEWHLAAIAFNAMMEFYWAIQERHEHIPISKDDKSPEGTFGTSMPKMQD